MGILNRSEKKFVSNKQAIVEYQGKKYQIKKAVLDKESNTLCLVDRIIINGFGEEVSQRCGITVKLEDICYINDDSTIIECFYPNCPPFAIGNYAAIEEKTNYKEFEFKNVKQFYLNSDRYWFCFNSNIFIDTDSDKKRISDTPIKTLTPLEYFKQYHDSKYKLIETEDELSEYLESKLSCDDWCRLKLVKKMKEIGLGDGFINGFADLIGNDLDKYYQMIDLANECNNKDILMYLFIYKFGKKEK